jgi:alanyl-tRNA synthetase
MRLYYDDAYTAEFAARVVERLKIEDRPAVILDRTYFYPTSGGQPNDTGTINGVTVVDVTTRKEDAAVVHWLAGEVTGDEVTGVVDWARRFDHMQHHTGQHILSQAFVQVASASTVGFHLSGESVTIDLDRSGLSDAQVNVVEDLANQIVFADRPVTARLVKADETEGVRMRKLPEHLLTDGLRVIDIDGFDVTACGGTHVARTGEIGIIKVLKLEKRGDKLRVEFRCGGRALRDYREKNAIANQLSADLTCALSDLPQAVGRLQEDFKAAQRALKAATNTLLDYEAERLLQLADTDHQMRLVAQDFPDRDFNEVRGLATRLAQNERTVALLAASGAKAQLVFARSADLPWDMNALLKQILPLIGGQPPMAQGGGSPAGSEQVKTALAAAQSELI